MKNVYIVPVSNKVSILNFNNTIKTLINYEEINNIIPLKRNYRIWGFTPGIGNKKQFESMKEDDLIIFVQTDILTFSTIKKKLINTNISKILWNEEKWQLITVLNYEFDINLSKRNFLKSLGYSDKDNLMGNRRITERFWNSYPNFKYLKKSIQKTKEKELDYIIINCKKIKRNKTIVEEIKRKYNNKCQVCGFTFKQRNGNLYSEAAHILPLASSKLDIIDNLLVLCPNHHKMLDYGTKDDRNSILEKCNIIKNQSIPQKLI